MNSTQKILRTLKNKPTGLWLFSRLICFKAPYFSSIKPRFTRIETGVAEARLKKRRAVTNHIGTVHAIAMANLCEFVAGTVMEVSIDDRLRWIPRGMTIEYLAKATTHLTARCTLQESDWTTPGNVGVEVEVTDDAGTVVSRATVPLYVSEKPPRKAVV